jgi:uncharacterized membrane protein YkoI
MKRFVYIIALSLCAFGRAEEQTKQNQPAQPVTPGPASQTTGERVTSALKNVFTDWRLEDLPQPVQKTVREQSAGQPIADIDRENRSGRTVWEIEFEKAGKNTEIHVAEDGTVLPEDDRLFGRTTDQTATTPRPSDTPAVGTPAGSQTGRSLFALGTQWEDLPQAVQQKAAQFGGKEKVADIDRENWNGKVAYEVEFRREGRNLEVHFGEDGVILESNDPAAAPPQGAAAGTEAGRDASALQPLSPAKGGPLPPPNQTPAQRPQ